MILEYKYRKDNEEYNHCIFAWSLNSFIGSSSLSNPMMDTNIIGSFRNVHLWEIWKNSVKEIIYFSERSIYILYDPACRISKNKIQIPDAKFVLVIPSLRMPTILKQKEVEMN